MRRVQLPLAAAVAVLLLVAQAAVVQQTSVSVPGKYDFRRSFKKPYFIPGSTSLAHFTIVGDAIYSPDYIRLAPSVRSQRGAVWSDLPTDYEFWSVEILFMVTGRGRIGGDGMAFWYTKESKQLGPVFGNQDKWDGLGVLMDTYDNDNMRNNPSIIGFLNDGHQAFKHDQDGDGQHFGQCVRHYRNPASPIALKITYLDNKLTVAVDTAEKGKAYVNCFEFDDLVLPKGYYFGISGATGGLADDHDVFSFETTRLFGQSEVNVPKLEETQVPVEKQKSLDEAQHKIADLREKKEQSEFGTAESRGQFDDLLWQGSVVAKMDNLAAMYGQLAAKLDQTLGRSPAMQAGRIIDEQSKLMARFNDVENQLRSLTSNFNSGGTAQAGRHAGSGTGADPSATRLIHIETKLTSFESALNNLQRTISSMYSDISSLSKICGNLNQGNTQEKANTSSGDSFGVLAVAGIVVGVIVLAGGVGFAVVKFFGGKSDFKKFN